MTILGNIPHRVMAVTLWGCGLILSPHGQAEPTEDGAFATLQAEAKKSFNDQIAPFIKTYCAECHGDKKMKGGLTFSPALKNPGDPAATSKWNMALANVGTHDMPPDEADKQPTEEERQKFLDLMGKIKYLSPREPGPFVIRRLTKMEYGNTLRDLYGVDPMVADELPDEVFGEGYLNTLSPLQSEQYLAIANQVLGRILAPIDSPATEVQKRLFGEAPTTGTDPSLTARNVARALTRNAYRRPATEEELDVLVKVYDLAVANKLSYPAALRLMLKAVLISPQFLYITPATEAAPGKKIIPLDDYQLASRLSYLLWATMPDAELSALADAGKLHEPAILKAQVQRLLTDQRSRALFDGFGTQWLGLGDLQRKTFDTAKFPQMTSELRSAMIEEARLFFDSIVRGNKSLVTFVESDYTYMNETLAGLYGLGNDIKGMEMRQIKLLDANRGGILSMPGILAITSLPNRTSAVKRGIWVLEQVLGQKVPPAPPNVPTLEKQDQKKVAMLTLRQRTELHRTNPVCANCHKILDPIGFGLENFDAIGRWRDQDDTGGPIDATGELPGGKQFATPRELKALIAAKKPELARNLTEKLLAYALCRQLEGYDQIVVDKLMETIAQDGYRMQTLISEIITSYPFLNQRVE